jgi:long-chain fatty acid transport protein
MLNSRFLFAFLCCSLLATSLAPRRASAGNFYLTDRGVRPMAMGGAFVAGAEGAEALWYNPAGLSGSGRSVRAEGMVTLLDASFQRIDDNGVVRQKVDLDQPILPIPLIGYTDNFHLKDWTFAIGLFAPNSQTYQYPRNGPQRYSMVSTNDSIIAHLAGGIAWSGIKNLSIGIAPTLIAGRFKTDTVFSACDGVTCSYPESPEDDAPSTVDLNPFFAFQLGIGVTYDFGIVKFGMSADTPYDISGKAKLKVTLPDNPVFDKAYVDGDKIKLTVPFPWMLRFGVEARPIEALRIETAFVIEGWARQDHISVDPQGITMRNILGIGDYEVGKLQLQRGSSNVYSMRLGGEYDMGRVPLIVRAGGSYDTSSFDEKVLSPLTLDSEKVILGLGLTWKATDTLDFDVVYGHVFLKNKQVRNSTIEQPTALRPAPMEKNIIANGNYTMEANYFGLGLTYRPAGRQLATAADFSKKKEEKNDEPEDDGVKRQEPWTDFAN